MELGLELQYEKLISVPQDRFVDTFSSPEVCRIPSICQNLDEHNMESLK